MRKLSIVFMIVAILVMTLAPPAHALIRKKNMAEGVIHLAIPFKTRDIAAPLTVSEDWQDFPVAPVSYGDPTYEFTAPFDGHIIGISVYSDSAVSAGYMEFEPTIDGTRTGLQAKLDTTNTQAHSAEQKAGVSVVSKNQTIGVDCSFDSLLNNIGLANVNILVIFGENRE